MKRKKSLMHQKHRKTLKAYNIETTHTHTTTKEKYKCEIINIIQY